MMETSWTLADKMNQQKTKKSIERNKIIYSLNELMGVKKYGKVNFTYFKYLADDLITGISLYSKSLIKCFFKQGYSIRKSASVNAQIVYTIFRRPYLCTNEVHDTIYQQKGDKMQNSIKLCSVLAFAFHKRQKRSTPK